MSKKVKKTLKSPQLAKSKNDFFFLVVISVFAAFTIFSASYLNTARREAIQASQKTTSLDVAPLDLASPSPTSK